MQTATEIRRLPNYIFGGNPGAHQIGAMKLELREQGPERQETPDEIKARAAKHRQEILAWIAIDTKGGPRRPAGASNGRRN